MMRRRRMAGALVAGAAATALGMPLIERLRAAGMTLAVDVNNP